MTDRTDFADRAAARLLGVDVDADAVAVRGQFRRRARAIHPDTSVSVGCVDLGRLVEARDRLVDRAERRAADAVAERKRREDEAAALLDRLRSQTLEETRVDVESAPVVEDWLRPLERPRPTVVAGTRSFEHHFRSSDRRGLRVDLAG